MVKNIILMKIEDVIPYEKNPRINKNAVSSVANSIKEFGFKNPIIVDKNNVIIAGHTRLKAAKKLKMTHVPVIVADDLSEEQVKAFRLADNKTSELAEWDDDLLNEELGGIFELDMSDFGFEELDLEKDENDIIEDEIPEVDENAEPTAKIGDIWQLGKHRVMCGDSINLFDVNQLINDELADLVVTDPPYNMNYKGAGNASKEARKRTIINDNMRDDDFDKFLDGTFNALYVGMKDGASFYMFYKELGKAAFINALDKSNLDFKQELIWVKDHLVLGGSKYQSIYEPILFGCKGTIAIWNGKRKQRSVIESIDFMTENELRESIKKLLNDEYTDIFRENKQLKNDLHPTMKPIRLLAKMIRNSSNIGNIVLDLFGGSGSTLIACEQIGRVCYMMEIDPHYVDVIIKRWENLTGGKAQLISSRK